MDPSLKSIRTRQLDSEAYRYKTQRMALGCDMVRFMTDSKMKECEELARKEAIVKYVANLYRNAKASDIGKLDDVFGSN